MFKTHSYFKSLFFLLLSVLFSSTETFAQSYNYLANGSDYYLTFSYSGGLANYCSCSNGLTYIYGRRTSHTDGNLWMTHTVLGTASSGSKAIPCGPGETRMFYTTWHYSGWDAVGTCSSTIRCTTSRKSATPMTRSTAAIKKPRNVQASDNVSDNYIEITWDKGSDIPDANLNYKIYSGTTLLATVGGTVRYYKHAGLNPGTNTTYRVTTYTTGWGGHESNIYSSGAYDNGSTFSLNLQASDAAYTGRTFLTWNDVSTLAEEIEISRIDQGVTTQIGVVSKYARSFSDYDGIPGYTYNYKVIPVKTGATFIADFNDGSKKVNGQIKGKVVSTQNAGVSGVLVYISASVDVNGTSQTRYYRATTDASGYYEIPDIYYYKTATYSVTPFKSGHKFDPPTLSRKLDMDNPKVTNVDFTDTTVFTVRGNIAYPIGPGSTNKCGIQGVKILLNNNEIVQTDLYGNFAFVVQDEGTYNIKPVYKHHHFDQSDIDVNILADVLNLQFYDIEQDTLKIVAQGGCNSSIGVVELTIRSTKDRACYEKTVYTNANCH
jgi:hypothetical protein